MVKARALLLANLFGMLLIFSGLTEQSIGVADAAPIPNRPNVVMFLIDDLGWADLGCYGSKFHKTPNLDKLASEGMRFTQAYAACPVCSPTRTAVLTGRYPQRTGITTWLPGAPRSKNHRVIGPEVPLQLPASETTIAEALKPLGYVSASIGKWHLGGDGSLPTDHGFDVNIAGDEAGSPYNYFAPYTAGGNKNKKAGRTIPGLEQAPEGEYLTDRLAAEAESFIENNKSRPFFLYLPHYAVHTPLKARQELIDKYGPMPKDPNGTQQNPIYAAMMETMDQAVGRVLKRLDDSGLSDKTIVIFTSDNGGLANGNGQMIAPTSNAPLRDGKSHLYEGGIRVPLIVRWPGATKPGTTSDMVVSSIDLFPTILDACGTKSEKAVDGISLTASLKGDASPEREAIYWHFPHYNGNAGAKPGSAIRAGDWKLIEFHETGRRELFHVAKDFRESNNVIDQQPEIAKSLHAKLVSWRESVGARMPTPNPDYAPNEQKEDGSVQMHSSTAEVFGTTLRYEPLPHKDTLGFWVRQEDWAQFEFTITKPGRFRLVPHVGCGTNGGSLVHFEVSGPSNEPLQMLPLTVPATGGFQKFVPQDLGEVTLAKPGRYTVAVKPQKKEGVAVMDIRRIELRPVTVAQMLPDLKLLDPFWRSTTIHRESILFLKESDDQPADGKLLFPAKKVLRLHAADGSKQFELGKDFIVSEDGARLIATATSTIPRLSLDELFPPKGKLPVWSGGPQPASPCALMHKTGDPETHVLFDNGHWFHDQQVEVTYERERADWSGAVPQFDAARLPKTLAKLKAKEKLTIGVSGDSITYGLNASGLVGAAPFMPIYPELVAAQLRETYGTEVNLVNRAVGGWNINHGLSDVDKLIEHKPDLVIVAYGMNDVGYRNPEAYKSGVSKLIERLRTALPNVEIILVATMLGNDQWRHTPREMFPLYLDALKTLSGHPTGVSTTEPDGKASVSANASTGIALADLTSLWTEMLKRKRDCDLTGNGVNHPSDFGHRVYASAVLSLLIPGQ